MLPVVPLTENHPTTIALSDGHLYLKREVAVYSNSSAVIVSIGGVVRRYTDVEGSSGKLTGPSITVRLTPLTLACLAKRINKCQRAMPRQIGRVGLKRGCSIYLRRSSSKTGSSSCGCIHLIHMVLVDTRSNDTGNNN